MSARQASRAPRRLVFGLIAAERALRRWIDARAQGAPVGAAGAGVLFYLGTHGAAPIKDIAHALGASPAATTGLLNRLSDAGVIEKSSLSTDARSKLVTLTETGQGLLPEARMMLDELNERITEGFSDADLEVVQRWLTHVAHTTSRR